MVCWAERARARRFVRRAREVMKRLKPLLDAHGLALFNGEVQVVRLEKFD